MPTPNELRKIWRSHIEACRRLYDAVVFEPAGAPPNVYNLWQGFAVDPQPGDWSLFKDHIFHNICCGNLEHAEWLLDWLAHLYQNPGGKKAP